LAGKLFDPDPHIPDCHCRPLTARR
jgi:hypothetical protein